MAFSFPYFWNMTHDIGTFNLNNMGKVGALISIFYAKTWRFMGFSLLF